MIGILLTLLSIIHSLVVKIEQVELPGGREDDPVGGEAAIAADQGGVTQRAGGQQLGQGRGQAAAELEAALHLAVPGLHGDEGLGSMFR